LQKALVPSQKCGRGVFFKGRGALSRIWSGTSPLQKWSSISLQKWLNAFFLKSWAGHSLNTLVGHSSYKKLGRDEFSPCSPWRPPLNTWASKIGPRELKFGRRSRPKPQIHAQDFRRSVCM
ncbi:unnamed protein product, partial [Prunus brigantina]